MPLESLTNPEAAGLDIHDLSIEAPPEKQETFFDPKKDITGQIWEEIGTLLRSGKIVDIGIFAHIKPLDAEHFDQFNFDESDWQGELESLKWSRESNQWSRFFWGAAGLIKVCPTRVHELQLDREAEGQMRELLQNARDAEKDLDFYKYREECLFLFPDLANEFPLTEQDWARACALLESSRKKGAWWDFMRMAGHMRLQFSEHDVLRLVTAGDRANLRKELERSFESYGAFHFLEVALWLHILAADEAGIANRQYYIIPPKPDFNSSVAPPLPDVRYF